MRIADLSAVRTPLLESIVLQWARRGRAVGGIYTSVQPSHVAWENLSVCGFCNASLAWRHADTLGSRERDTISSLSCYWLSYQRERNQIRKSKVLFLSGLQIRRVSSIMRCFRFLSPALFDRCGQQWTNCDHFRKHDSRWHTDSQRCTDPQNRVRYQPSSHSLSHDITISTQRVQTPPRPLHCRLMLIEHVSYKMFYLIRSLQRRPLVSDSILK